MKKKPIDLTDYAGVILKHLPKGVLLTTKAEKVNSMVIGWGSIGINWGKPVFTAYIREGRFTRRQLSENMEFSVNIPVGDCDPHILRICGGKSGRDTDKINEAGLTLVDSENFSVPAIKEFPLTLECRVIYVQKQELGLLSEEINNTFYPQNIDSTAVGANKDAHVTFFGEILDAYILED